MISVLRIDTEETNQNTDKVDITTTAAIRMVLDKCANVDEALEMLSQYDMHSSGGSCYHFHIVDTSGHSVVVEYIENDMVVIDSNIATNFLLAPGDWDLDIGHHRFDILQDKITDSNEILSEKEAMQLLQAVSQNKTPGTTQWSVVYNQTKGTAKVCIKLDYTSIYEFELKMS